MERRRKAKRFISALLAIVMVLSWMPGSALTAQAAEAGLCGHHTEHTAQCGYRAASGGAPCKYDNLCDRGCGGSHTRDCAYTRELEKDLCSQSCMDTDGDGFADHAGTCAFTQANGRHEHDGKCGYRAADAGSPCTFQCEQCAALTAAPVPETPPETGLETTVPEATEADVPETTETTAPETTEATVPETTETTAPEITEATVPETTETTAPETTEATVPETTGTTAPETTESTVPETTEATAPETTEATIPGAAETTAPETTESTVPETTEATAPETTEATIPETTEAAVPETTEEATVPETTEATVPETTEATVPGEPVSPVQQIQELINALPEHVTEENRDTVTAWLQEILSLYDTLTEAEQEQVDMTLCVLLQQELDAANVPELLAGTGAFTVTGGMQDTDYSYANGVLTVLTAAPLTISGTSTSDRIEVASGVNAQITLSGVNINVSGTSGAAAFKIADNSTGNVTVTLAGANILRSGAGGAGLQKGGSSGSLTITGSGSLTAIGGGTDYSSSQARAGAGIGGGGSQGAGNITISGGTVRATGGTGRCTISGVVAGAAGIGGGSSGKDNPNIRITGGAVDASGGTNAAGIGGGLYGSSSVTISAGTVNATGGGAGAGIGSGNGANGTVTITGGTVTATGGFGGAGIGGGTGFISPTGYGNGTVIITGGTVSATGGKDAAGIGGGAYGSGSLSTGSGGTAWISASSISGGTDWSGVIFNGGAGQIYGDSYTLSRNAEIPGGKTLTIPGGKTLTVGPGATLTNSGTLTLDGGTLTCNGTLSGGGQFLTTQLTEDMITVPTDLAYNGSDPIETIRAQTKAAVTVGGKEFQATGWTQSVTKTGDLNYTVTYTKDGRTFAKGVTLMQSGTTVTAALKDGPDYIYSDKITVTATAAATGAAPAMLTASLTPATAGQMAVYKGSQQVSAAVDAASGTAVELTVDSTALGAGEHTLTVKYTESDLMAAQSAELTVNVKPAALTITANDQTITYGDRISTAVDQVTATGLVSGDKVESVTLTASSDQVTAENKTITPSAAAITNGGTDVTANYAITYAVGALTINKSVPTIAFASGYNPSKAYDGQTIANPTEDDLTITGAAFEDVTFTWTQNAASAEPVNAGTYTLTASIALTDNTEAAQNILSVTIAPRTLTEEQITVTLPDNGEYTWAGEEIKPVPTLTWDHNGEPVTIDPSEYTLTYGNNGEGGSFYFANTPYISMEGKEGGNYQFGDYNSLSVYFTIICDHQFGVANGCCNGCGMQADVELSANGASKGFFGKIDSMSEFWDKNVVPMYDAATGQPVTVQLNDGATVDQFQPIVCGGVKGNLIIGNHVTFNNAAYNSIAIQNSELSLSAADDAGTFHVQIAGPLADEENYNSSFTLNSGAINEVMNRNGGQFVMKGGRVGTLTTGQDQSARHPQVISISGGSIGSATIQTGSDVTISGGSIDSLTYAASGYVPAAPYEPGTTKISGGSFGTITVPEGEAVSQLLAEGYAFYNQADNTPADVTGSTVSSVFAAKAGTHILNDLDFLEEEIKPGTLETDGYSWTYTANSAGENKILTLNLKDCTIPGNIVLPDNMESITIRLQGENSVGGFVSTRGSKYGDYYYDPIYGYHITITGSGTLEIGGMLGNRSADGSTLLIDAGAAVTVKDGVAANGTVTVQGDLTATGGYAAVNTGKLRIEGGSLTVSGQKGVSINGIYTGYGRDFAEAFVMTEGAAFTADCADFNLWVYDSYNSIADDADVSAIVAIPTGHIPDGYALRHFKGEGQFGLSVVPEGTPDSALISGTGMGGHLELKAHARKAVVLNKASATLQGDIGLNYYITLPQSVADDTGAYVQFTVKGKPAKVMVSSITPETDGTYKFTYRMNAKEMHDKITFAVYDGSGNLVELYSKTGNKIEGSSFDYSLDEYFEKLSLDTSPENEALVNLAKATLAYGSYAQKAFGYDVNTAVSDMDLSGVTVDTLAGHKMIKAGEIPAGLTLSEMTLILKTETMLCLYFKGDSMSQFSFTLDGTAVTPEETAGGLYCIKISNISAKDLDTKHTLVINGDCTLTFDALSYAYSVVKAGTDEAVCNAVKALCKYNEAANVYFGA